MTPKALRAGRYTVCLDTNKTSEDTYMNWIQFCLTRVSKGMYLVTRKSNLNGNGQCWERAGAIAYGILSLAGRDGLTVACGTELARYFGLAYADSTRLRFPNARVFRPKGRKGAAPSLLRPNVRDKNVARKRASVGGGFMARDGGTNPLLERRM